MIVLYKRCWSFLMQHLKFVAWAFVVDNTFYLISFSITVFCDNWLAYQKFSLIQWFERIDVFEEIILSQHSEASIDLYKGLIPNERQWYFEPFPNFYRHSIEFFFFKLFFVEISALKKLNHTHIFQSPLNVNIHDLQSLMLRLRIN